MDPDAALKAIRDIIARLDETDPADYSACAMAEHFQGLDDFLTVGGFLPKDWKAAR